MMKNACQQMVMMAVSLLLALFMAVSASAQANVEQKITFHIDGKIGNEMVKKGTYTLVIPEAAQGMVEIKAGKKVVVSIPYTKQDNAEAAATDKVTYRENGDGTRSVATITPKGQKFTLLLGEQNPVAKR